MSQTMKMSKCFFLLLEEYQKNSFSEIFDPFVIEDVTYCVCSVACLTKQLSDMVEPLSK